MSWGMGAGWLFWIVIAAIIIWTIRALFHNNGSPPISSRNPKAKDILDERFARGEISEDEYKKMQAQLNH